MEKEVFDALNKKLKPLQEQITKFELAENARRRSNNSIIEFIIKKDNQIVIRMDANKNHSRAHIHLDFGTRYHAASYAIDTGECLAGDDSHCSKEISAWIAENRALLMEAWEITRTSPQPDDIIGQLKASKFWY